MEVSEVAGVSHSFLINVIPSLKDNGFVSVAKGKEGKRKKFVNLTVGGRDLLRVLEIYQATLKGNFALVRTLVKR